jgi:hypothetical protein
MVVRGSALEANVSKFKERLQRVNKVPISIEPKSHSPDISNRLGCTRAALSSLPHAEKCKAQNVLDFALSSEEAHCVTRGNRSKICLNESGIRIHD